MKISKLFHTLYAFLMFLPVMVLPLFAININQKEVDPLTAQIEETEVVTFNQFFNLSDLENRGGKNLSGTNDNFSFSADYNFGGYFLNYEKGHSILAKLYYTPNNCSFRFGYGEDDVDIAWVVNSNTSGSYSGIINRYNANVINFVISDITTNFSTILLDVQLFDLTIMFGEGNEPTLEQFNLWYPNEYYPYSQPHKEILYTGVQNTLSNTDIGSQFLYSLYNPLKDYFNLPNYMNLGGLYDWFMLNLFSGYNSPVYFIIFDLMIYWLAMSVLWLIFDVLMYVPSMIHKMLDKARME